MSEQELEQIINRAAKKAAEEAVTAVKSEECGRCALFCIDPDFAVRHEKHHQAVDEFLEIMRRMNEAKWTTFKAVLSTIGVGLVLAFLWFFFGIKQP